MISFLSLKNRSLLKSSDLFPWPSEKRFRDGISLSKESFKFKLFFFWSSCKGFLNGVGTRDLEKTLYTLCPLLECRPDHSGIPEPGGSVGDAEFKVILSYLSAFEASLGNMRPCVPCQRKQACSNLEQRVKEVLRVQYTSLLKLFHRNKVDSMGRMINGF